jgi:hypothetical protein
MRVSRIVLLAKAHNFMSSPPRAGLGIVVRAQVRTEASSAACD